MLSDLLEVDESEGLLKKREKQRDLRAGIWTLGSFSFLALTGEVLLRESDEQKVLSILVKTLL